MERQAELRARQWTMSLQAGAEWQEKLPEIHRTWNNVKRRGPMGADTPARVAKFVTREMRRSQRPVTDPSDPRFLGIERRFGPTLDYEYTPPKELAQAVGKSVARLVEVSANSSAVSALAAAGASSAMIAATTSASSSLGCISFTRFISVASPFPLVAIASRSLDFSRAGI